MAKIMTTAHLTTDNRETDVLSSLKKSYFSEGVSTLNVDSKICMVVFYLGALILLLF